jgi:aryl-alcohol dehydrogenase-like predicted oxidoreductase
VKLALGTVQFGLEYGIANRTGRVTLEEARAIVQHARSSGIDTLDTAMAYGDSECRLGEIGVTDWRIVSKLPAVPDTCHDVGEWVVSSVHESLRRLRVSRLYGLLLHRPAQLLEPLGSDLYRALQAIKGDGLVEKIGVSIYDPAELDTLCPAYSLDLVQSPFNLLDRRLKTSGWLARLAADGVELHVRSVFLQGLLLMAPAARPPAFRRWAPLWAAYDRWLAETGLSPVEACLRDALSVPEISRVIVGVDSLSQLSANLESAAGPPPAIPDPLQTNDVDLLNPARWTLPA